MKIRGYIDYRYPDPAPFIRALVLFRELRIEAALALIIDTGASNTLILWKDIQRLAIDPLRVIGLTAKSGLQTSRNANLMVNSSEQFLQKGWRYC